MTGMPPSVLTVEADLDESRLTELTRAGEGSITPAALSYPDFTYRHYWGTYRGWVVFNLSSGRINHVSNVFASASESSELASTTDPVPHPFMGAAAFQVHNVVPYDGGVSVRLYIDWGDPLFTQVSYVVVNR